MSGQLPPSSRRSRDARAAGLRPRARLLAVAGSALIVWAVASALGPRAVRWLGAALERALAGELDLALGSGPALAGLVSGLIVACGVAAVVAGRRRPSPRALGVPASLGAISPALTLLLCAAALVTIAGLLRPTLAAAARSVDAGGEALVRVWVAWPGRALLTLALVAGALGVIERLASARKLWQGLHLTREQAREQARAAGDRRR